MKIAAIASPLLTSDNMQGSVMGMDSAGMDLATFFLRDKIYSNKIKAVVREYLCNAIDEHNKFEIRDAVQTGIRVENNENIFYVRDYAKGLSEEGVRSIFGMYFRSTKSKTNDSIGGFGVGSKAGHCYSDTFFVTSHFEGKKSTYTCVLGGGDSGVPVGHIYKIDESETAETGLEVCVPVQNSDRYYFSEEIETFVYFSPANIQAQIGNNIITPTKTVKSFESEGVKFRLIEDKTVEHAVYFMFQMGGVTYQQVRHERFFPIKNCILVVDVPVGSMSVPISRESFENTTSNKNFLLKVEKIINDLAEKDLAQFKTKNAVEILEDCLSDLSSCTFYEGEFFAAKKNVLFSGVYSAMSNTTKVTNEPLTLSKCGKFILLVSPKGRTKPYWRSKIENHCKKTGENYYVVCEEDLYTPKADIEKIKQCFYIFSIKRVKYEKNSASGAKLYTVYDRNGCKLPNQMKPLELHNLRRELQGLPKAESSAEAVAQAEEHLKNCTSLEQSSMMFIRIKRGRSYIPCFQCNSISLIKEMVKLGWVECDSEAAQKIIAHFSNLDKQAREIDRVLTQSQKTWIKFHPRTKIALKKHKNALKMCNLWTKIEKENSLRSKIISSLNSDYYARDKYSRQDVRAILLLK
jgi:hypothetical protein